MVRISVFQVQLVILLLATAVRVATAKALFRKQALNQVFNT
jgi:hypothetical protein